MNYCENWILVPYQISKIKSTYLNVSWFYEHLVNGNLYVAELGMFSQNQKKNHCFAYREIFFKIKFIKTCQNQHWMDLLIAKKKVPERIPELEIGNINEYIFDRGKWLKCQ